MAFQDESGFTDKPVVRKTWGPKGCTPVIKSCGGWKRRTAVGTIVCTPKGNNPRFFFTVQKENMNKETCLLYLEKLKKQMKGRKTILIWDGLPAHRAKIVRDWIEANKSWLSTERFPAYDPDHNPVEYVWAACKTKDMANYLPKNMYALEKKVRKGFKRIDRDKSILKGCLKRSELY